MKSTEFFSENLGSLNIENTVFDNPEYEQLNGLLSLEEIQDKRDKWTRYKYNGFNVPRCTEIINSTINKDYLNKWAAKLGESYNKELNKILDTGSLAHQYIEDYINYGKIKSNYVGFDRADQIQAMKAYHNFMNFMSDMKNKGYKIEPIVTELPFSTPWYGGTMDLLAYVTPPNGVKKFYILDFKTSKKISYTYFIQLMLYAQAYNFIKQNTINHDKIIDSINIPLEGIGIIRIDKKENKYEYLFVDSTIDVDFINTLATTTSVMVNWYYNLNHIESSYNSYKKSYIERGGIDGIYRGIYPNC